MKLLIFPAALLLILLSSSLVAQNYAQISIANNTSSQSVSTSWTTITGFSASASAGMTTGSAGLTITQAATYMVQASFSFEGGSTGVWEVGVSIGGSPPARVSRRSISNSSDVGNVTLTGLFTLTPAQTVSLVVKAPSSTTVIPVHAQIAAVNIENISSFDTYALLSVGSSASTVVSSSSYGALNGFSSGQASSGWTTGSGQLSADASAAGTYLAMFTMSYTGTNNTDFDGGVSLGSGPVASMLCRRKLQFTSDIGNMTAVGILSVSNGTTVTPIVRNNESSSKTCTLEHATLMLIKIAGTGASSEATSHASMAIGSPVSQGLLATGIPKTVTGFSNQTTDPARWSFASNQFSPIGVTSGIYFVSYYTSFTSSAPSAIEFNVRVAGSPVASLTTERSTSSGGVTDNGAVGGCGILTVSAASDIVTFSLVDGGSSSPSLTINSVFLLLTRITQTSLVSLPVELSSLSAHFVGQHVDIRWRTETEIQNYGFDVERKSGSRTWETVGFVTGSGTSATPRSYHFMDAAPPATKEIHYRLRQRDRDGTETVSEEIMVQRLDVPSGLRLDVYPNPVRSTANLHLMLVNASRIRLTIHDLMGRERILLHDGELEKGMHSLSLSAQHLPSGTYVARVSTQTGCRSILIKVL